MNNCFNKDSFSIFNENIKLMETNHLYETRAAKNSLLFGSGRNPIVHSAILAWNYFQEKLIEYDFMCLTPRSLKIFLVKFFISDYNS